MLNITLAEYFPISSPIIPKPETYIHLLYKLFYGYLNGMCLDVQLRPISDDEIEQAKYYELVQYMEEGWYDNHSVYIDILDEDD